MRNKVKEFKLIWIGFIHGIKGCGWNQIYYQGIPTHHVDCEKCGKVLFDEPISEE